MSVKIRPYRRGGWEVDIRTLQPDGSDLRERKKAPVESRSGAMRWGQARERELLLAGPDRGQSEVPTLASFVPVYLRDHARANRQKPSAVAAKESILRRLLLPRFGSRRLDEIKTEDVQRLKSELAFYSPKTVNNVLTVLSSVLKVAVEWSVIPVKPCAIRLLKTNRSDAAFFDFAEYERLIVCATKLGPDAYLAVVLGGEAGLRVGEMLALRWADIDLTRGQLLVERADWQGQISLPKGGRARRLPMTSRLASALSSRRRSARGLLVFSRPDGSPLTRRMLSHLVEKAARQVGLKHVGIHLLRHSFCSHLAMRGAPARAIQELAGHRDLSTTQRYMHLSPAVADAAIRLLESPEIPRSFGDVLETEHFRKVK